MPIHKEYHEYKNKPKNYGLKLGTMNRGVMTDSDGSVLWKNSMDCSREFKAGFKKSALKRSEATVKVTNIEEAKELREKAKLENPSINIGWINDIELNLTTK